VEKAIKEMREKKATGDDDVPGDVLKLLGEDGLRLRTQLIDSIYIYIYIYIYNCRVAQRFN
jgi:hypothetical protein